MPDSIALEELKRLGRLLAEAAAEARDNPVGAITQYTRGMARAGLESVKGAVKAELPVVGRVAAQVLDNALRPALNTRPPAAEGQADLTADPSSAGEVGEIVGFPMPGGGADKAAVRKIFTKIYDQTLLQQIEDATKRGMTKEDIFQRFGAAKHEGITNDWVQELPGQLKIKRNWNAREVTAPLGEFVDYPELYAALKRYGISDPETIPVRRLPGAQGHYQSAADAANRAAVGELAFGDMDMLYVAGHELQHLVDHIQTGIAAGAGAKEAVDAYLAGPGKTLANKLGIQNGQDLDRAFFKNPAPEVQKLFNAAWQHYHNNPGELLADISGTRSQMPPSPSTRGYPFTIVDYSGPRPGRAFYDAGAVRHEQALKYGLDMTDPTKGMSNVNYGDIGANVDSLDNILRSLDATPRRLRKEEDPQALFKALLNSRD